MLFMPSKKRRFIIIFFLVISGALLGLTSCSDFSYYKQAISGQMRILNHRIPIQRLINDPNTPIKLKNSLKEVESIRIFAKNNLALPLANNYATYVDLHRPFVVLNLFASKPLSFTPKTWCYPIIGCQSYRGYFDTSMAKSAKAQLDKEGWDTWLGGVSAYSTLGWFDDPLLNTFFTGDEASLAALIFHELSHHILYINGDTTFNESFATAVELEGTRLWLKQQNKTQIASDFTHQFQDRIRFITLVNESIDQLKSLYQSSLSDQEKTANKAQLIKILRQHYQAARLQHPGLNRYSGWFSTPINNAKLLTVTSYYDQVPAFTAMIHHYLDLAKSTHTGMKDFFEAVKQLSKKDKSHRDQLLNRYLQPKSTHTVKSAAS